LLLQEAEEVATRPFVAEVDNGIEATHQQDVANAQVLLPISLKGVDADLTVLGHVGVEDLGEEETCANADQLKGFRASDEEVRRKPLGGAAGNSAPSLSLTRKAPPW
jgi:hypothetical protein